MLCGRAMSCPKKRDLCRVESISGAVKPLWEEEKTQKIDGDQEAHMGVIMQAFYWDCPRIAGSEYPWWDLVKGEVPALRPRGFTALWLPPASKAANVGGMSMGYDVYDYYDLGKHDPQKAVGGQRQASAHLVRLGGGAPVR